MRVHGTLKKWDDDRGYGFIALAQSREEIFVHISAFQRSDTRPCVGETISFEVRASPDGRKRAENVLRPGAAPVRERGQPRERKRSTHGSKLGFAALAVIAVGGYLGSTLLTEAPRDVGAPRLGAPEANTTHEQRFQCDGRTRCTQMTSCAEALYFLRHCPGTEMDGNGDGQPCEQQWCN